MTHKLTRRERAILKLLTQALNEIQHELYAAGHDDVADDPTLQAKQDFVDKARKRVTAWLIPPPATESPA